MDAIRIFSLPIRSAPDDGADTHRKISANRNDPKLNASLIVEERRRDRGTQRYGYHV